MMAKILQETVANDGEALYVRTVVMANGRNIERDEPVRKEAVEKLTKLGLVEKPTKQFRENYVGPLMPDRVTTKNGRKVAFELIAIKEMARGQRDDFTSEFRA